MDHLNLITHATAMEDDEKLNDSTICCDSSCAEEDALGNPTDDPDEKIVPFVKELAGPTKCSRARPVREIFPWLSEIYKTLRLNLSSEQAQKNVVPIMENYLRFIKEDLNTCLRYPNRCFILSKNMTKMLILFKDINKNFDDSNDYLIKLCDLLSIYTTLELRYSTKFEESKILVANRIALNYEIHLQSVDKAYILRIFISIKNFFQQKEIMCKVFEKYLKHRRYTQHELDDKLYVMYLIAFKYWRSLEDEIDERFKIEDIANSFMRPSPTLRVNVYYAPFIPAYKTTNENTTKFILSQHFNPSVLVKAMKKEELHDNEEMSIDRIIDLSLNEQLTNKNQIHIGENSLRSNFKLASVKLEKRVVVAVIDLTTEDETRKRELSWLNSLVQRTRSSKPISIPSKTITNVPSNVIEIIDLVGEEEGCYINEDMKKKIQVPNQMSETQNILLEATSLHVTENHDNSKIIFSKENKTPDNSDDFSLRANQTPENKNEISVNSASSDNIEIQLKVTPDNTNSRPLIVCTGGDNEKIAFTDNESGQIQVDIENTKDTSKEPVVETVNNVQQNNNDTQVEIFHEGINNNINKCLSNQLNLTEGDIPIDKGVENDISNSLHTISNILSDTSVNDSLNENNRKDISRTVNKMHLEESEEFNIQNETAENESAVVIENQNKTETVSCTLNQEKSEESLIDGDCHSVVLNLKTYSNRNKETSKTKTITCTTVSNANKTEIVLNKKSDTDIIDAQKDSVESNNYIPFSEIGLNLDPSITTCSNDYSYRNNEIKTFADELLHITESISANQTSSLMAIIPDNGEIRNNNTSANSSLNLNNSTESISEDIDDDDIIKNIAKSLTMNPQKTYEKKRNPILPSINSINIPPLKQTAVLDLPAFSSSSSDFNEDSRDSNLLSILDESDHLDDENLDLNRNGVKDIDDIPIDKISPSKSNVGNMKSPTAGNVIFSITTNTRSALPPSKSLEAKALPKNSNVVFSTRKMPISRTENLVTVNKKNLNDNWIDPASEFEDNALSIHQNEIVSPPIEEFTKSDKTLFKTYLNKTDTLPSKTASYKEDNAEKNILAEMKLNEKERNSIDKLKSITTFTIAEHLQQETVDDNLINVLPNIQKRKSVSFLDVPQEKSAQSINRTYSNLNLGILNKINYKPATKLSGKECWASAINTYNSNIGICQHKPPLSPPPPQHSIFSSINMKSTRPTLRTSDPVSEHHRRLLIFNKNSNYDAKIFNAYIRIVRIDEKLIKPINAMTYNRTELEIQRKNETIKKTLSDFDRYLLHKKLENSKKSNIQLDSWSSHKNRKNTFGIEQIPSPKKRRRSMSKINSSSHTERLFKTSNEFRRHRHRLLSNSIQNLRRIDHKLQKKVVVKLEDIAINSKYQQYFSTQPSLSKQSNFLGIHIKSKSLGNMCKLLSIKDIVRSPSVKYNFRAHPVERETFRTAQTKTRIAAMVSRKRRNTIAPEIVVHVFKDNPIGNNKYRSLPNSICSDVDITETHLKEFTDKINSRSKEAEDEPRQNISGSKVSEISNFIVTSVNIPHDSSCKTISGNEEFIIRTHNVVVQENYLENITSPNEHCNEEFNILKPNASETKSLSFKESNININEDVNSRPVPNININPNHPPEQDKHFLQSIESNQQGMPLGNCKNLDAQIGNKDELNVLNEPSCSTEIINAEVSINNSLSTVSESRISNEINLALRNNCKNSTDYKKHVQHRDTKYVLKLNSTEPEHDNEVTSTQDSKIRTPASTCDGSSTNISLSEIDVQNDQVDTSNLVDSVIISRSMNRGRRKSVAFDLSNDSSALYTEEWPKRRKTICEEIIHSRETARLDDMINIPSTTTIDPPRKKRGRPKGSKNKLKPITETTGQIVQLAKNDVRNKQQKLNKYTHKERTKDNIMSVSSITSNSSRDSDNEPLTKIRARLAQINESGSETPRAQSHSPEDLNVNIDIAKTYSKNNFIKNVFVPPEIEKIIEAEENVKSDCNNFKHKLNTAI